jgi:hypothetical protein
MDQDTADTLARLIALLILAGLLLWALQNLAMVGGMP